MIELQTLGRVRLLAGDAADPATPGQPKRIALLAYLAVTGADAGRRRDELLALFWPELGDEEARRALRQALHYLRRVLGPEVIVGEGEEVTIPRDALRCDAVSFEQLAQSGDAEAALALYQGDFLQGFHVAEVAPEFEEWIDRTRSRLRRRAAAVAWLASGSAERAGDATRAVERARRACDLELDAEAGWRKLMRLQERLGDRAGALRAYAELSGHLARELGVQPSPETVAVADSIRAGDGAASFIPTASTASTSPTSPTISVRRPTWPFAVAVVLLAGFGGFFALRARREARETPSLMATGALADRDRIVVGDFADGVGDTLLAAAATQAVRVDLAQSPLIRVLSPTQLRSTLVRMQRSADLAIDDSLAREIALRQGAKAYVTGAVAKVGNGFSVTAQLVAADHGEVLASVRENAADSTQLIAALDRTGKALRLRIGESLRTLREAPALNEVTTASLPALRVYTRGYRLFVAGQRSQALPLLEQAVQLDTGFAMAWRTIAIVWTAMAEPGRSAVAGEHAMADANRLPFRERHFMLAGHAYGSGDYETAIRDYEEYLRRDPRDASALSNMALAYRDWRRLAPAESLYREAIHSDSTVAVIWYGLHSVLAREGKFSESRRTLDEIARRFPGDRVLTIVEVQDAAARQEWEEAERRAEANIAANQGDTLQLVDAFEQMAGIVETQGRLAEAERYWRTQLRLSAASHSRGRHIYGVLQLALVELRYHGQPARARALMDSALARTPLDSVLPGDRPYYELARFYAAVGEVARARALLASADANDRLLGVTRPAEQSWTRGVIALAASQPREAESELRQASETLVCSICPLPDLARAYEAVGKPEAALLTWERYTTTPWLWRYETDASELGLGLKRMAELYAKAGEGDKAAMAQARLVQLWRRADPELQRMVSESRPR